MPRVHQWKRADSYNSGTQSLQLLCEQSVVAQFYICRCIENYGRRLKRGLVDWSFFLGIAILSKPIGDVFCTWDSRASPENLEKVKVPMPESCY
jgi:hypothetical protein